MSYIKMLFIFGLLGLFLFNAPGSSTFVNLKPYNNEGPCPDTLNPVIWVGLGTPFVSFFPMDTTRPGPSLDCFSVAFSNFEPVDALDSVRIVVLEVKCTGSEDPILLYDSGMVSALESSWGSKERYRYVFFPKLVGPPGEESECYFLRESVLGNTIGKCYKLEFWQKNECDSTYAFSYFQVNDLCMFDYHPTITASDSVICAGECISFSVGTLLPIYHEWSFPGAVPEVSQEQSPQNICYPTPGLYPVTLRYEDCITRDTIVKTDYIHVLPAPQPTGPAQSELVLVAGDSTTLQACATGNSYAWSPPEGLSCTDCPSPIASPASSTEYTLLVGAIGSSCTDTCRYHIIVGTPPLAAFTPAASKICQGDCLDFSFSGSGQVDGYSWLFPGGQPSSSTQASPQRVCYPEAGSYPVMLVVHNTFGTDTLRLENAVTVVPEVVVTSAAEQRFELAFGDSLQLEPCALGQSYQWSPADGLSCTDCPNPLLTATIPATYTLEVSNDGMCIASCQYVVEVAFDQPGVYIPSAFSPNGDGINDLFTAYGKFLQIERLLIFHRWGGMAYEAHGPDAAWDGTSKDKPAQPGVYVYLLEYTDTRTGERFMKSGEVVLVR